MNFYYLCATQYSNLGDLLINKMLIDNLCKYGNVYVDCFNIPMPFKQYLLENDNVIDVYQKFHFSIRKGNLLFFNKYLKKLEIDCFVQSPGPLGKFNFKYNLYFKFISKILKFNKVKYVLIGNCCSTSRGKEEKISIDYADAYFVRSYSSVDYLKKYGIKNVFYIPDLAVLYREVANIEDDKRTVLFSFRKVKFDYVKFIDWLKSIITIFRSKGYKVKFIYQVQCDKEFTIKIIKDLGESYGIDYREEILWYNDIDFYAGSSFVISNRLHSLLLGAVHNAIPLALIDESNEQIKIKDVYNSLFPQESNDLMISELRAEKIYDLLSNNGLKQKVKEQINSNYVQCEKCIEEFIKFLTK